MFPKGNTEREVLMAMEKYTIKNLASLTNCTVAELADKAKITPRSHLVMAASGRVKLTLEDGRRLAKVCKIKMEQIKEVNI